MTSYSLLLTLGITLAATASASNLCLPGDLNSYVSMAPTGCTLGNLTFDNFSYSRNGVAPTSTQINVIPTAVVGSEGFQFLSTWNTAPGQSANSFISYEVKANVGIIFQNYLASIPVEGFGGNAYVTEDNFVTGQLKVQHSAGSATAFPPYAVSQLNVLNHLYQADSAQNTNITNTFQNQTPEPVSFVLFGSGLAAFSLLRRKLKN